jgi:hypothetical protein
MSFLVRVWTSRKRTTSRQTTEEKSQQENNSKREQQRFKKRSANRKPQTKQREQVACAIESQREQHQHATLKPAQQTKSPAGSNRIVAKEKEFFALLSDRNKQQKTNLNQQQERKQSILLSSLSRQQATHSSSREPAAIALSPHQPRALGTPKEKGEKCTAVESNHKQHNAQTSKEKRTIRQSRQLAHWIRPLTNPLHTAQELKQEWSTNKHTPTNNTTSPLQQAERGTQRCCSCVQTRNQAHNIIKKTSTFASTTSALQRAYHV